MDLKRLKYFVKAAEELNFSRAARRLNVSQSVLSRSIKALESDLGVELFFRNPSGISLTKAGRAMLQSAKEILLTWDQTLFSLKNISSDEGGTLRVLFCPVALEAFVGPAITSLNQTLPNLTIRPEEVTSHQQVDALLSGDQDVCIIDHRREENLSEDFDVFDICEMKMAAVVSDRDELRSRSSVRLGELAERDLISYDSGYQRYCEAMVRTLFERDGVEYRPAMFANTFQSMIASVCSGRGYGVLPLLGNLIVSEKFRFLELESTEGASKTVVSGLVKKGENRKSVVTFLQECRRIALVHVPQLESEYREKRENRGESSSGQS